jgi:hypothetical protein
MSGADRDEARRRLALSLAISGDRSSALQTLSPLAAKGDTEVSRVRAFILALSGDSNAAMNAINAVMPGSAANVAPFLQRLPSLSASQKAAAVNLGIFPDSNSTAYAYAAPTASLPGRTASASTDRLAGIDSLLQTRAATAAQEPATQAQATQLAYARPPAPAVTQRSAVAYQAKIWLQLASGQDVDGLAKKFQRLRTDNPDLFNGIKPYVSRSADRARLLVGPFHGESDASIFADDLKTIGIDAFRFTDSQSDRIAPLAAE